MNLHVAKESKASVTKFLSIDEDIADGFVFLQLVAIYSL